MQLLWSLAVKFVIKDVLLMFSICHQFGDMGQQVSLQLLWCAVVKGEGLRSRLGCN